MAMAANTPVYKWVNVGNYPVTDPFTGSVYFNELSAAAVVIFSNFNYFG